MFVLSRRMLDVTAAVRRITVAWPSYNASESRYLTMAMKLNYLLLHHIAAVYCFFFILYVAAYMANKVVYSNSLAYFIPGGRGIFQPSLFQP